MTTRPQVQKVDVVVLGAGAAGMMCAIEAGKRGRRVVLLDHAERVGKKILISGGGRCNFTNIHCRPENFLSENPHFAKSALGPLHPIRHDRHGRKTRHPLPREDSGTTLLRPLRPRHRRHARARMRRGRCPHHPRRQSDLRRRATNTSKFKHRSEVFRAESVVVATGGLSIPKMGATALGYTLAEQFGLRIVSSAGRASSHSSSAPRIANRWCDLAGVSAEVVAQSGARPRRGSFREKMLVTHRGLSGPAILQASSYWQSGRDP